MNARTGNPADLQRRGPRLLFGAEFTRVWAARHGVRPKPEEFAVKDPTAVHAKSALTSVD